MFLYKQTSTAYHFSTKNDYNGIMVYINNPINPKILDYLKSY